MPAGATPSRILSATAKFLFLRAVARSSITSGISLPIKSSEPPATADRVREQAENAREFFNRFHEQVERGNGGCVIFAVAFEVRSSQYWLVILASSNSSPMAPPVLKSSSIAARNRSRHFAATSSTGSLRDRKRHRRRASSARVEGVKVACR